MATEFDYAKAWRGVALPEWESLPQDVVAPLAAWTHKHNDELKQDSSCDVVPPDEFRELVKDIASHLLARIARASYFCGHWYPGDTVTVKVDGMPDQVFVSEGYPHSGTEKAKQYIERLAEYPVLEKEPEVQKVAKREGPNLDGRVSWRLAHMCDWILRQRLGVGRDVKSGRGFMVHDGGLRYARSTRDSWTWEEVGLASERNLAICKEHRDDDFEQCCEKMREDVCAIDQHSRAWFVNKKRWYSHKEGTKYNGDDLIQELNELDQRLFEFDRVDAINFHPHPFMIDDRHFDGGRINVHKAGCGYQERKFGPKCDLPHDKHTCEHAVMVKLIAPFEEAEFKRILQKAVEIAKANNIQIEGFGFLPSKFPLPTKEKEGV